MAFTNTSPFVTDLVNKRLGVGVAPTSPFTVAGVIESTTGGFKFPDGSTQTVAAAAGVTGSGTANQLAIWSSSSALTASAGNLYAGSGGIGIGADVVSTTFNGTGYNTPMLFVAASGAGSGFPVGTAAMIVSKFLGGGLSANTQTAIHFMGQYHQAPSTSYCTLGAIGVARENTTDNNSLGALVFGSSNGGAQFTAVTEGMRLNSSQRLLVGTTTDNGVDKVQISGSLSISTPLTVANGGTGQSAPYGTFASRPAAGASGRVYIANDSPTALWVDDGAAWHPLIYGQVVGTQPKLAANFTNFGAGSPSATLVDRNGALNYQWANAAVGGSTAQGFFESLSSATAHVEAVINVDSPLPVAAGVADWGVFMRESSTSKMVSMALSTNNGVPYGMQLEVIQWTNSSTRTGGQTFDIFIPSTVLPLFLKMARSGSNTLCQYSTDGQNWTTVHTYTTASAFTTAPDQVGIVGVQWTVNDAIGFNVLHYLSGT